VLILTKYEYKVLNLEQTSGWSAKVDVDEIEKEMNTLGDDGWELVSSSVRTGSGTVVAFFKRIKSL
jgi:hypothetical protein